MPIAIARRHHAGGAAPGVGGSVNPLLGLEAELHQLGREGKARIAYCRRRARVVGRLELRERWLEREIGARRALNREQSMMISKWWGWPERAQPEADRGVA